MGVLSTFEREPSRQVLSKAWDSLDGWKELSIHTFLVFLPFIRHYIVLHKKKQLQDTTTVLYLHWGTATQVVWLSMCYD